MRDGIWHGIASVCWLVILGTGGLLLAVHLNGCSGDRDGPGDQAQAVQKIALAWDLERGEGTQAYVDWLGLLHDDRSLFVAYLLYPWKEKEEEAWRRGLSVLTSDSSGRAKRLILPADSYELELPFDRILVKPDYTHEEMPCKILTMAEFKVVLDGLPAQMDVQSITSWEKDLIAYKLDKGFDSVKAEYPNPSCTPVTVVSLADDSRKTLPPEAHRLEHVKGFVLKDRLILTGVRRVKPDDSNWEYPVTQVWSWPEMRKIAELKGENPQTYLPKDELFCFFQEEDVMKPLPISEDAFVYMSGLCECRIARLADGKEQGLLCGREDVARDGTLPDRLEPVVMRDGLNAKLVAVVGRATNDGLGLLGISIFELPSGKSGGKLDIKLTGQEYAGVHLTEKDGRRMLLLGVDSPAGPDHPGYLKYKRFRLPDLEPIDPDSPLLVPWTSVDRIVRSGKLYLARDKEVLVYDVFSRAGPE